MNVLALDSCLGAVSAAVRWRDAGGQWRELGALELRERGQAERLMPMLAEVMGKAGLAFRDLERISVTVGPGSFTGVRVGIAAARGLALASGLPVVTASSLEVLARQAVALLGPRPTRRALVAAAEAGRGMVYLQWFAGSGTPDGEGPVVVALDELAATPGVHAVTVVGPAAESVARALLSAGADADAALGDLQPDARALAGMAATLPVTSPVRPLYLRVPDAKPQAEHTLPRAPP